MLRANQGFRRTKSLLDEVQRNIAIVRRLEDAFNGRDYLLLREIIASAFEGHNPGSNDVTVEELEANNEDFVEHSAPPPAMPTGKTGAIARFKWLLDACDDLRAEIMDIVADGRHVAIRARFVGTDPGGVFPGVPATGRPFDIEGIDIASINDDGKFVEHYGILDMKDTLEQLGITPNIGGA